MLIVRANPKGGRALRPNHFPLHEDKDGNFGFLVGYDKDGDKILIPISIAREVATQFGANVSVIGSMMQKLKPKVSFKERIFILFFGKQKHRELREYYEDEIGD